MSSAPARLKQRLTAPLCLVLAAAMLLSPALATASAALEGGSAYNALFIIDAECNIFESFDLAEGEPLTAPAHLAMEGYTFLRWEPEVPETMPARDLVFYAQWSKNIYTVQFIVDSEVYSASGVGYADRLVPPADPSKEGFTFAGWVPKMPEYMPAQDLVFTASWVENYMAVFVVDAKVYSIKEVGCGNPVALPPDPLKDGYAFEGWEPDVPAAMPAEDLVFTAVWAAKNYHAVFYSDGTLYRDILCQYGAAFSPPPAPAKEGYSFAGWNPQPPGVMPALDLAFEAMWNINTYKAIFKAGETVLAESFYQFGESVTPPEAPFRADSVFIGWDPQPGAMPAADTEYRAVFRPKALTGVEVRVYPYAGTNPVEGTFFDPGAMTLGLAYDNGTAGEIKVTNAMLNSGEVTVTPASFGGPGAQQVSVTYRGFTVRFELNVVPKSAQSVTLKSKPDKTVYVTGEPFAPAGGVIYIDYNNETRSELPMTGAGVAVTGFDSGTVGTKTLTVTYTDPFGNRFSTSFTVTVVPPVGTPASTAAVSVAYDSVSIVWTAVQGASGYVLYRYNPVSKQYDRVAVTAATSYIDKGLVTGATYLYKSRAYKTAAGVNVYGAPSAAVSAKPVPAAPQGLKAVSASYNSLKISWAAVAGATGYAVYRYDGTQKKYVRIAAGSALNCLDQNRLCGGTYYYKIIAYRKMGSANVYGDPSAPTAGRPVPAAPSAFTASRAGSTSVKTSWSAVAGAHGYEVYRSATPTGGFTLAKTTSSLSFTQTGLTRSHTYYFKVRAYRTVNGKKIVGAFSPVKSATPG